MKIWKKLTFTVLTLAATMGFGCKALPDTFIDTSALKSSVTNKRLEINKEKTNFSTKQTHQNDKFFSEREQFGGKTSDNFNIYADISGYAELADKTNSDLGASMKSGIAYDGINAYFFFDQKDLTKEARKDRKETIGGGASYTSDITDVLTLDVGGEYKKVDYGELSEKEQELFDAYARIKGKITEKLATSLKAGVEFDSEDFRKVIGQLYAEYKFDDNQTVIFTDVDYEYDPKYNKDIISTVKKLHELGARVGCAYITNEDNKFSAYLIYQANNETRESANLNEDGTSQDFSQFGIGANYEHNLASWIKLNLGGELIHDFDSKKAYGVIKLGFNINYGGSSSRFDDAKAEINELEEKLRSKNLLGPSGNDHSGGGIRN